MTSESLKKLRVFSSRKKKDDMQDQRDISLLVVGGGLGLAVAGIAGGVAASFGLQRAIQALLFEVEPGDPATYTAVTLGLLLTALLAASLPARRAAGVQPASVLRGE